MDHEQLHERVRSRGVNPVVYWVVRAVLQPFFHAYFRLSRIGREHIPASGPVILAANHRSFLDPFIIGTCLRRPLYYVAKKELFEKRWQAWVLNALGAFPVDRGNGDRSMIESARAILERGDVVVIFPEGTRIRPGSLGRPRRGVGRLALETGAPVVPIALIGTEAVRRGWRIRPHKVRVRCGRPLTFPRVPEASPQLAAAVTERIWPCVMLQWEWLGGLPPLRRAAVVGAGSWGTALAVLLARAGLQVDLGCRTGEQAETLAAERENARYLPGLELPAAVTPMRASDLELSRHDLVVFAVPAAALPAAAGELAAGIAPRAGVVVCAKGLVPPVGRLAPDYVAERAPGARVAILGGPAHPREALEGGAALVAASRDRGLLRQLDDLLSDAGLNVGTSRDVTGVALAGAAKNAAALAAAAAAPAGANAAGAAAGRVFGEVTAYGARVGVDPLTFTTLAGTGDLVATVLAAGSRNRRAGELLARGVPAGEIQPTLGQAADAVDTVPLLAARIADAGLPAPALDGLAELLAGATTASTWTASLTEPAPRRAAVRAA